MFTISEIIKAIHGASSYLYGSGGYTREGNMRVRAMLPFMVFQTQSSYDERNATVEAVGLASEVRAYLRKLRPALINRALVRLGKPRTENLADAISETQSGLVELYGVANSLDQDLKQKQISADEELIGSQINRQIKRKLIAHYIDDWENLLRNELRPTNIMRSPMDDAIGTVWGTAVGVAGFGTANNAERGLVGRIHCTRNSTVYVVANRLDGAVDTVYRAKLIARYTGSEYTVTGTSVNNGWGTIYLPAGIYDVFATLTNLNANQPVALSCLAGSGPDDARSVSAAWNAKRFDVFTGTEAAHQFGEFIANYCQYRQPLRVILQNYMALKSLTNDQLTLLRGLEQSNDELVAILRGVATSSGVQTSVFSYDFYYSLLESVIELLQVDDLFADDAAILDS